MINISYYKNENLIEETNLENEDYKIDISEIENQTSVTIYPKTKIKLKYFGLKKGYSYKKEDKILVNGYQSWTDTREFSIDESLKTIKMPKFITDMYKFKAYGDYNFKKTKKHVLHGFTYGYIRRGNYTELYGSYNEENAYLIINFDIPKKMIIFESDCENKVLEKDESFELLNYKKFSGNLIEVQKKYFSSLGRTDKPKLKGYTSWYNHYQNIDEKKIEYAIEGIDSKHFDLFQIDDGYETFVGDWLDIDKNKFPNGLEGIVKKIHDKNLKAGIWLAPFICETKSELVKNHPDFIYQENGEFVFAGGNWSKSLALDIRKKEVKDYIEKCLKYYINLGFDFFKLDFLYAVNLIKDENYTRAQLMREMMVFLRKVLKDKLILGCGLPLSSGFNLVDYCRIGPDVSLKFDDIFYMKLAHRERISTKVTLQNTIYRYLMDGTVFRNDPDVYLLRDDNIDLNEKQKKALLLINHLCGSLYLTSDNVKDYSKEKLELLEEAEKLSAAEIVGVEGNKNKITIKYRLNNEDNKLIYNCLEGVLKE